jgi:putative FmdB family regulatory protein
MDLDIAHDDVSPSRKTTRAGRCGMPMYDYKCLDCGKESLVVLTLKEHESGKAVCPLCQSTNMKQLYTSFIAHTTKKS